MKKFIQSKGLFFTVLVLFVLVMILLKELPGCNRPAPKADTAITQTISYAPPVRKAIIAAPALTKTSLQPIPPKAKPSKNYDSLAAQYEKLLADYYAQREYVDSQQVDSSKIKTYSTVAQNKLQHQRYELTLRPQIINRTMRITQQAAPRRQLYFNYGIDAGYNFAPINNIQWSAGVVAGFTYKDKKDSQYTANGSFNTNNQLRVQLVRSGKISFRGR